MASGNPSKVREPRALADLQADSRTVAHELNQLTQIVKRYNPDWIMADRLQSSVYIQSFAIHCRATILFLFGHLESFTDKNQKPHKLSTQSTDVIAADFDNGWPARCPRLTDEFWELKKRADKEIAHITTDRRGVNQPGGRRSEWPIETIANLLCEVFRQFLESAPAENFDAVSLAQMRREISETLISSRLPARQVSGNPRAQHIYPAQNGICGRTVPEKPEQPWDFTRFSTE